MVVKFMDKKTIPNDTFGRTLQINLFGGSHTSEIGIEIRGLPSQLSIDKERIQHELNRRRPGQNNITTGRKEADLFQITSGLHLGKTTGEPLTITIPNIDTKSKDYSQFKTIPRPSHVDYPARLRYGDTIDLRGSGRFSGRMTAPLVAAGAIARQILHQQQIEIAAYASQIGNIHDPTEYTVSSIRQNVDSNLIRTVDAEFAHQMENLVKTVQKEKDSIGGVVSVRIEGFPAGLGDPWFHSLESDIAAAIMSIPGVRGIEFGTGFAAASMRGSDHNDPFVWQNGKITTKTNHCGGIIGGISIGTPITFQVAVKPTASIGKIQHTLNLETQSEVPLEIIGRHDPCIVPRIVVVLEAIVGLVLLDVLYSHS
ncbi:Chorismate synthase [Candidatus Lokiarchaeum ossiferum]|uniref:Chorismate synthase n=1 Tax=Candidatus Lokiarchaeum ossiferum TaxID=2951803 RepID=A0ABY6HQP0_9ARCH|nr:Chorismate synthase [Candidatus Lokiarchaeum sp. B-35]